MLDLSTIPLMPLTLFRTAAYWRGRLRRTARGVFVTADLRAAHIYELPPISVVPILMLTRPF